ncbi:hypothetical protein BCR33DRAFT_850428 [Rhizoclosmatium globosum]|uniref:Transcription factor domain-containing protein n=1 Tax=Rhizoclosmatium globosum TaxID=329046 RepID=A0A1Y2CD32_9FUNG|nr:hypothetical protein BCR33DRAFT_850428 [Rhizoclosmatium globosum]|eukprot:ORY44950.1 hypothetical protein BCR33DRAFT_850428 [Rhizoclosmatium globosum]
MSYTWKSRQEKPSCNDNPSISTISSTDSGSSFLSQTLAAFETSLVDFQILDNTIEDPDLMPTMNDYLLVYRWLTNEGRKPPNVQNMDADYFLGTFFTQSALSRLSACALAVDFLDTSDATSFEYYRRARKAVIRESGVTSFENVQAMFRLYQFAGWKGQPLIGMQFLKMAFEMMTELRLDVDPDDSPWLYLLQLTERQKEDRRRTFWSLYQMWSLAYALSLDVFDINISVDKVKPPKLMIENRILIFDRSNMHVLCKIYEFVGTIKRYFVIPPKSLSALIRIDSHSHFRSILDSIHAYVPKDLFLVTESVITLKTTDVKRFQYQLGRNPVSVMAFNLYYLSSQSILDRPILFATSLASCLPIYLSFQDQRQIMSSVNQCLECAHRIANLVLFWMSTSTSNLQDNFASFEAVTVFWFVAYRMKAAWKALIEPHMFDWIDVKRKVDAAVQLTQRLEMQEGEGMTSPVARCMEAMQHEMQDIERFGGANESLDSGDRVEPLELGMKVLSLNGYASETAVRDPFVLLGLLGMEVKGGIRWKGRSEEGWRLFWKLNG